jgi:cardiolipin synthase
MVIVIIGRDLMITGMRWLAIKKGTEIKTTRLAKTKTAFQMTAIILILMVLFIRSYRWDIQETFLSGHKSGKTSLQIATNLFKQGIKMLPNKEIDKRQKRKVFAESIPYFLMLATTIVTAISGIRYLTSNINILKPPYHIFKTRGDP